MSTGYRLRCTPEQLKTTLQEEVKRHTINRLKMIIIWNHVRLLHKEARAKLTKLHEVQRAIPLTLEKSNGELLKEVASEPVPKLAELGRRLNNLLTESTVEQQNARKEWEKISKDCEAALTNVEVPTPALFGTIDKNKSLWSAKESAANKLKAANPGPAQVQAETGFRQAEAAYDVNTLDMVTSLRDYYEIPRIRDWKLFLGNVVATDLRLAAAELAQHEALTVEVGRLDLSREVDDQVSKFFTVS